MRDQIKQFVDEALENDSLSELLGAIHEAFKSHSDKYWQIAPEKFPVMRKVLKRHGEEAQLKIGTYLMMMSGVIERTVSEEAKWKTYRNETRAEHEERNRKERIAEAKRALEHAKRI